MENALFLPSRDAKPDHALNDREFDADLQYDFVPPIRVTMATTKRPIPLVGREMSMLANCRVLIVEDDPVIALELVSILEDERAIVVAVAQSVASAFDAVREYWLNCALLDIYLRGETSYPVADTLSDRHLPFAFATGYMDPVLPTRHMHRPVISKPFDSTQVIEAIAVLAWR